MDSWHIYACKRRQPLTVTVCRSLDTRDGATVWPLLDRVEALETEKAHLQRELSKERARKSRTFSETALPDFSDEPRESATASSDMSMSVAVVQ